MLFLINEQKKKTRTGGKGLCRVFKIQNMVDGIIRSIDLTEEIAIKLHGDTKYFDGIGLTIHYGSGTGYSIISEYLRNTYGNDIIIQDVSIF